MQYEPTSQETGDKIYARLANKIEEQLAILSIVGDNTIRYDKLQELTDEQKQQARDNIQILNTGTISYTDDQTTFLTPEQQKIARDNLDISDGVIRYDVLQENLTSDQKRRARENLKLTITNVDVEVAQTLTEEQKATARANIDAVSSAQIGRKQNANTQYAIGDICLHDGVLQQCTSATQGEWNTAYWTRIQALNNSLTENEITALSETMTNGKVQAAGDTMTTNELYMDNSNIHFVDDVSQSGARGKSYSHSINFINRNYSNNNLKILTQLLFQYNTNNSTITTLTAHANSSSNSGSTSLRLSLPNGTGDNIVKIPNKTGTLMLTSTNNNSNSTRIPYAGNTYRTISRSKNSLGMIERFEDVGTQHVVRIIDMKNVSSGLWVFVGTISFSYQNLAQKHNSDSSGNFFLAIDDVDRTKKQDSKTVSVQSWENKDANVTLQEKDSTVTKKSTFQRSVGNQSGLMVANPSCESFERNNASGPYAQMTVCRVYYVSTTTTISLLGYLSHDYYDKSKDDRGHVDSKASSMTGTLTGYQIF